MLVMFKEERRPHLEVGHESDRNRSQDLGGFMCHYGGVYVHWLFL